MSLATTIDVLVAALCSFPTARRCASATSSRVRCSTASSHPANEPARMGGSRCPAKPCDRSGRATSLVIGRPPTICRALVAPITAGRQALRTGAAVEAETYFGRALEVWPAVSDAEKLAGLDHAALLEETSEVANARIATSFGGDRLVRRAASEPGRALEPLREGQVWLRVRDLFRYCSRLDECDDAVERALVLIPPSPPSAARAEALTDAALSHYFANRPAEMLACAQEAVAVAEAAADPDIVVYARNALGSALGLSGDAERELAYARETLALCSAGVSPERVLVGYVAVADALANLVALRRSSSWPSVASRSHEQPASPARAALGSRTTGSVLW